MYNCTYSTDIFVTLRAKLKMVDFFEPLSFIKQVNSCGLKEAGRWQIAGDSIGTYQSYLHTYSLHIWWLFTVVTPSACFIYLVGGVGKQARRSGGSSRIPWWWLWDSQKGKLFLSSLWLHKFWKIVTFLTNFHDFHLHGFNGRFVFVWFQDKEIIFA